MTDTAKRQGSDSRDDVVRSEAKTPTRFNWRRVLFMLLGLGLFSAVNFSPAWPDAVDPMGAHFVLTVEGKASLGLFLLAATWWVFEVLPIGVTGIVIGVVQALFLIRPARTVFTDFFDPSVWFIIGSVVVGMVFSKTGLTKRMAYKMLGLVGEKTHMILLGCYVMTSAMAHIMAHTAVAAAIFPLLMTIYALYEDNPEKKTNFGMALFMGMAFVAGAGSIVTSARRGPRRSGHRLLSRARGENVTFPHAHVLHVPRRLGDDLPALGLLHGPVEAREARASPGSRTGPRRSTNGWDR